MTTWIAVLTLALAGLWTIETLVLFIGYVAARRSEARTAGSR